MYDLVDIELVGPKDSPTFCAFVQVELTATFTLNDRSLEVFGFYSGDGLYKIRFMPDQVGTWNFETRSNVSELDSKTGKSKLIDPQVKLD